MTLHKRPAYPSWLCDDPSFALNGAHRLTLFNSASSHATAGARCAGTARPSWLDDKTSPASRRSSFAKRPAYPSWLGTSGSCNTVGSSFCSGKSGGYTGKGVPSYPEWLLTTDELHPAAFEALVRAWIKELHNRDAALAALLSSMVPMPGQLSCHVTSSIASGAQADFSQTPCLTLSGITPEWKVQSKLEEVEFAQKQMALIAQRERFEWKRGLHAGIAAGLSALAESGLTDEVEAVKEAHAAQDRVAAWTALEERLNEKGAELKEAYMRGKL